MNSDLREQLRRAAGALPTLDDEVYSRVTRPPRTPAWAIAFSCAVIIVLALAGWGIATMRVRDTEVHLVGGGAAGGDQSQSSRTRGASGEPGTGGSQPEGWEVIALGRTSVPGPSRVAVDQAELDEAWASFEMREPAPTLRRGHLALLLSVAGDCNDASQARGLNRIPAVNDVGEFAVLYVDPDCAKLDRFGTAIRGVRTLYAVAVPVDNASRVVGFEAVTAPVHDLEWRFLASAPDHSHKSFGIGNVDQAMLNWAWATWHLQGDVPEIPNGWRALVAPVPGTCSGASHMLAIEAVGYRYEDGFGTVFPAAVFDPGCAEIQAAEASMQARSVYVVIVKREVAATLHGPEAYIDCRGGNDVGECEKLEKRLIYTKRSERSGA